MTLFNSDTLISIADTNTPLTISQLSDFYDTLSAIPCEFMLGQWRGVCLNTGHSGEAKLSALGWAGKQFNSINDVMPIMSLSPDGALIANPVMGTASLRMVEYRGVSTATMVYDKHPIFDHFKKLNETTLLGVMDAKSEDIPLYFVLKRAA
jgi:hypothetical protein